MTILLDRVGPINRRDLVKGVGLTSLGLLATASLGGCESLIEAIRNRPVRRRLRTGSAAVDDAVDIYKDAVTAMKALPSSNPRSWIAQRNLHGQGNTFNFCQHGTNHFFTWHRAYLFYFERICRELTGEEDWGLPYWNWNQNPVMHPEFTAGGSVLNHPRSTTDLTGDAPFSDDTLSPMFTNPDFLGFGSQIEGTPHNLAHVFVGMDMVTAGSPNDPIFYAHHCMVDYCWAKWQLELDNELPDSPMWETDWNHFVDQDGNPTEIGAATTILMPYLSYRYEPSVIGTVVGDATSGSDDLASAEPAAAARASDEVRRKLERRVKLNREILEEIRVARGAELSYGQTLSLPTRQSLQTLNRVVERNEAGERAVLSIDHAMLPMSSDFMVRVFVNKPDASASTPTSDPHFAGTYGFFGTHAMHRAGQGDSHGKTDFLVDASPTLERLSRMGVLNSGTPISVQLVAVPVHGRFERPGGGLTIENLDLTVSRFTVADRSRQPAPEPPALKRARQ